METMIFWDDRARNSCRKAKPVAAAVFSNQMMTKHWRCLRLFCEGHPHRVSFVVIVLEDMEICMYVIVH